MRGCQCWMTLVAMVITIGGHRRPVLTLCQKNQVSDMLKCNASILLTPHRIPKPMTVYFH